MTFPSHHSSVPLFHSLGCGTVEQTSNQRNNPRNMRGTNSLKALANKVLERNMEWNKPGTATSNSVPPPDQPVPLRGTNDETNCVPQYDDLSYAFEERAVIMEYDDVLARKKKIAAEKETGTDKTDKFEMDANVSGLSIPPGGLFDKESLLYDFEERIAIAEYDGHQGPIQAQRIAYLGAFMAVLNTLPYRDIKEDHEGDWLNQRIKTTREWLADQGVRQPK